MINVIETGGVPRWVGALVRRGGFSLQTTCVDSVRDMDIEAMRAVTAEAFNQLFEAINRNGCPNAVRVWSFIPGITDEMAGGGDRYMAFNAGRYDAMSVRFGDRLHDEVPAASGVGCVQDQLVIHVLGSSTPGQAVENPRQVPAYSYSRRWGELPPCFARATHVNGTGLFVAGTAAIIGEDTNGGTSTAHQWEITMDNLRRVLRAQSGSDDLRRFSAIRAYVVRAEDMSFVQHQCEEVFPHAGVELVHADLCRRTLLVEVEGIVMANGVDLRLEVSAG